jgi:hypothetical protein
MGYDVPDPYHQPERFGLTLLGEIEWGSGCFEFDLTAVWVDQDGQVYWADDSGCSCPTPFEDYLTVNDLRKGTKWDALAHLRSRASNHLKVDRYVDTCAKVAGL